MATPTLEATAKMMVADGKGLLAIDESTGTCNKRFAKWAIPQTPEAHRLYRELIVNTPGLNESISGAILYDETIRQQLDNGTSFAKALASIGIIPGIKVDLGAQEMAAFPGEKVTEGLDGLRARLAEYRQVEGCLRHRRRHPHPRVYRSKCTRTRSLCGTVSRGRPGSRRRTRSPHGGRSHSARMLRSDRASLSDRVRGALYPTGEA